MMRGEGAIEGIAGFVIALFLCAFFWATNFMGNGWVFAIIFIAIVISAIAIVLSLGNG